VLDRREVGSLAHLFCDDDRITRAAGSPHPRPLPVRPRRAMGRLRALVRAATPVSMARTPDPLGPAGRCARPAVARARGLARAASSEATVARWSERTPGSRRAPARTTRTDRM
jgi:hypothetical protein